MCITNPPKQLDVVDKLKCRTIKRRYEHCKHNIRACVLFMSELDNYLTACKICKGKSNQWLLDSGASVHVTNDISDFISYKPVESQTIRTAKKGKLLSVQGVGTVLINHTLEIDGVKQQKNTRLYPVYYVPDLDTRLMSLGEILKKGNRVNAQFGAVNIETANGYPLFNTHLHGDSDTLYWLNTDNLENVAANALHRVSDLSPDYDIWHKRLGHPSKEVMTKAPKHVIGFNGVKPTRDHSICQGCAEGKMASKPYPPSTSRSTKPFELIHTDLKDFPTTSYHRYRYYVSFIDDYSGHANMHGTILSSETTIFTFLRLFETFRSHLRTQHQFEHYLEISNFTGHFRTIFDLTSHLDLHAPSHGPHSTLILHPSRDHTSNSIDFELVPGLAISSDTSKLCQNLYLATLRSHGSDYKVFRTTNECKTAT